MTDAVAVSAFVLKVFTLVDTGRFGGGLVRPVLFC